MYAIEFKDGTKLEGLTLNGDMFFSPATITKEFFTGKLNGVKITSDDEAEQSHCGEYAHMLLIDAGSTKGIPGFPAGSYFVLEEKCRPMIEREQNRADIEYLAMMSDIDLEG